MCHLPDILKNADIRRGGWMNAAVRLGMWIRSPSGAVVSQLFILIKVFKRILRPVAFSMVELHLRLACGQRERKSRRPPVHTHTQTQAHTHLLVCPSQDAVLSQMAVEERPECIGMGVLPLQNTSAYWDLATGHQGVKREQLNSERMFSLFWRILLELLLVWWMFEGVIRWVFHTGVLSFLSGVNIWFSKTLVETVCEDSNIVWSVFR